MVVSVIIDLICACVILQATYPIYARNKSKEKNASLICMLISFVYCLLEVASMLLPFLDYPRLIIYNHEMKLIMLGFLNVWHLRFVLSATKIKLHNGWKYAQVALYIVYGILMLTNKSHHLVFKDVKMLLHINTYYEMTITYAPVYYFFCATLMTFSTLILVLGIAYYRQLEISADVEARKRSTVLLVDCIVPIVITNSFLLDDFSQIDVACIAMGFSGFLLIFAFKRHNYLSVVQNGMEMVLENMNSGVLLFDIADKYLYANEAMLEEFPEVKNVKQCMEQNPDLADVLRGNREVFDCHDKVFSCQRYEVFSKRMALLGYAVVFHDITAVEKHAIELEKLKNEAEKANFEKTKFLTNVTHDIRTPLNTILGMSEIAVRQNKDKDIERFLKSIYYEGEGVLELVNSLLDLAKIEAGRMEFAHTKYNIAEVIYSVSNMVYMKTEQKNLEYKLDISPDFPKAFYGDPMRIKEIFQNLLSNAIKYTEEGSIRLTLSGEREEERYKIRLQVSDTGIGMSKEDQANLFKRFMRSKKAESVLGTGIGLNITLNLIELLGGTIDVESELNVGTTFTVTFYQEIADSDPLDFSEITREKAVFYIESNSFLEEIHVCFPEAKVLLVDDMEANLKVEHGLMELFDIDADMAIGGKKALEKVAQNRYDIIFLDHMMPDMDGIVTLQKIRELENGKNVPVIALTANAVAFSTNFYTDNGFDASAIKPLHTTDLLAVLKEYIPHRIRNKEVTEMEMDVQDMPIKDLMPEIDCVLGIKNIGGSLDNYNDLLQVYYNEMSQSLEMIAEWAKEDMEQFRIKVHGIKGASNNIGAKNLGEFALRLEEYAKSDKRAEILAEIDDFLKVIDSVMIRIDTYLRESVNQTNRGDSFSNELSLPNVYAILQGLSEYDMDRVEEEMMEIYRYRYPDEIEQLIETLKRYVDELDYSSATELLEGYVEKIS